MRRRRSGVGSFLAVAITSVGVPAADAGEVHIAVATNFARTARALATTFSADTGHRVLVSEGSTGKLYAQIVHGAPFEVLLAADGERPRRLEAEGRAVPGTRFVYALGRLVLWSPDEARSTGEAALTDGHFAYLAIANPDLAPYGFAARELLQRMNLWDRLQRRLVRGEDVGQTFHFVATGNAELGFVALSQVTGRGGSQWIVPPDRVSAIEQQALLLEPGRDAAAARAFLDFLRGDAARAQIERAGYGVPAR